MRQVSHRYLLLMKSPDIRIINKADGDGDGQQDMALSFKTNSPQGDQVEIKNGGSGFTNTTTEISYVDSYNHLMERVLGHNL